MTIKEMETESGMSRANIRFYETEGLLNPERRANGYREYSEEDLEILMRIKLLRALHVSLDEIKRLHAGQGSLVDTLNRHIAHLRSEQAEIAHAQDVCAAMCKDGVRYQTLDAQHYLDALEQASNQPPALPVTDVIPEVCIPGRRFFARFLDLAFYNVLWFVFLELICNVNIGIRSSGGSLLDSIASLALMFFLEPILLSLFGTTLGKWILGIQVTDNEGARMTYQNARARTFSVLLRGMGLGIPIYSLIRLWMSFRADQDRETLDWEYHSAITLKDEKRWRVFAYLGTYVAMAGVLALTFAMAKMPKNRGDITIAEFCENYNRLAKYYGLYGNEHLDAEGKWVLNAGSENIINLASNKNPVLIFEEKDGYVTGIQFSLSKRGGDEIISGRQDVMLLSILAFAGAQPGNTLFSNRVEKIVEEIYGAPFKSYQISVYGVRIHCSVEYSGYHDTTMGMLWPEKDKDSHFSLSFSIQKEEAGTADR